MFQFPPALYNIIITDMIIINDYDKWQLGPTTQTLQNHEQQSLMLLTKLIFIFSNIRRFKSDTKVIIVMTEIRMMAQNFTHIVVTILLKKLRL